MHIGLKVVRSAMYLKLILPDGKNFGIIGSSNIIAGLFSKHIYAFSSAETL
jgi:hypothetical protein